MTCPPCLLKRRYLAYLSVCAVTYFEFTGRFVFPIAMIGGMVTSEEECNNSTELELNNSFCWSEDTQSLILGSYFYGYTAQPLAAFVAKKFQAHTRIYQLWLLCAAIIQCSIPTLAKVSSTVVVLAQVLRGFFAGIMASYNFDFTFRWVLTSDKEFFLGSLGMVSSLGCATSGFIAGLITTSFGWPYVFYFSGILFLLGLIANAILVQISPQNSWYLSEEEKEHIKKEKSSVNGSKQCEKEDSVMSVICRVYVPAFCAYTIAYNFVIYSVINVMPFYLNGVLKMAPLFLSYLNFGVFILMTVTTFLAVFLVKISDKHLPWLYSRMLFIVVPMVFQVVFALLLTQVTTSAGGVVMMSLITIAGSTIFSGGLFLTNYELDPKNASFLISICNSMGQTSGFVGPLLMAKITHTPSNIENFDEVHKQRWGHFFFTTAGFAATGCIAIILAYLIKPREWINKSQEQLEVNSQRKENDMVLENWRAIEDLANIEEKDDKAQTE